MPFTGHPDGDFLEFSPQFQQGNVPMVASNEAMATAFPITVPQRELIAEKRIRPDVTAGLRKTLPIQH